MSTPYNTKYNVKGTNMFKAGSGYETANSSYNSITMSSSGQYLASCFSKGETTPGPIYTSNNYGVDWVQSSSPTTVWVSITSSSSGQYLAAVSNAASIYTSNNYGMTWTLQVSLPNCPPVEIVSSSSGQYLAVCGSNGLIWLSDNYGAVWTVQMPPYTLRCLTSISMSSSGQFLVACSNNEIGGSYIIGSNDFGLNWQMMNGNGLNWTSITSSNNGKYLAASFRTTDAVPPTLESGVYTSVDYGATWSLQQNSPNNIEISAITSSGSGQTIALCISTAAPVPSGCVYISNDYGMTWNQNPQLLVTSFWSDIAISTSGQYLAVCSTTGNGIFVYSNNADIGTTFGSMIEELQISQISQNNNSIYPSTYFLWSAFSPLVSNLTTTLSGYYGYSGISNQPYGLLNGYLQGSAAVSTISGSTSFTNNIAGVTLSISQNTSGSIYWEIPNFDYTQNFEVIANVVPGLGYQGNKCADQMCICVAGASHLETTASWVASIGNYQAPYITEQSKGLWCVWDCWNGRSSFFQSGTQLGNYQPQSYLLDVFVNRSSTMKMTVISIGGSRIASLYFGGVLQNSIDVTNVNWIAGQYLIISSWCGMDFTTFACSGVELNYI